MSLWKPSTWFSRKAEAPAAPEAERRVRGEETWFPPPTQAGIAVTEQSALTFTAVYAAINTISTDIACMAVKVYRREDDRRVRLPDHPAARLLGVSPDGATTAMRWKQHLMGHVLGWGNGYAEILRNGRGQAGGLNLLHPGLTEPKLVDGRLIYRTAVISQDGRTYTEKTLAANRVFHLAGLGFDGLKGYSPIAMARDAIGLGKAAEIDQASFYGNGSRPGGFLKHPARLSPDAKKDLKEDWNASHGGPFNSHGTVVLEEGLTWEKAVISPVDAETIKTRQFAVVEIARMYRTPPHKLGDYSQAHLANLESSNIDYIQTGLMGWVEAFEQEANLKLLTPSERSQGIFIEIDMNSLLRGNMQARADYYNKMIMSGIMTPNAAAAKENLEPIPNGDLHFFPLNMVALEHMKPLGDADPKPTDPPAPEPTPDPEPASDE